MLWTLLCQILPLFPTSMIARCPTSCGHSSSPHPRVASSTNVADSAKLCCQICWIDVFPVWCHCISLLSGHGFCEARGGDWGNREDTMRFDYDMTFS